MSQKKVLNKLPDFELKNYYCAFSWKVIFSIVRDLLNWIAGLPKTVIVLVGSERWLIVDLACMRKRRLNTLPDFELKNYSLAFSWKVIISIVKDFFKWLEGLRRIFIVFVGSERELNVDLAGLRKKLFNTLPDFELKNYSWAF